MGGSVGNTTPNRTYNQYFYIQLKKNLSPFNAKSLLGWLVNDTTSEMKCFNTIFFFTYDLVEPLQSIFGIHLKKMSRAFGYNKSFSE